jgi:predicted Holliday junction resolvase-like endonuclease
MEMVVAVLALALGVLGYITFKGYNRIIQTTVHNEQLKNELKELQGTLLGTQEELGQEREKNRTLLSQKKSSETRLGQISEHLVPFLEGCPYDPKNLHFLGNPIDFVSFDFDAGEITFIEVKSGNSKPTKRQKIVKNIVKQCRVNYAEIRINEKGVKHRKVIDRFENPYDSKLSGGDQDEQT